MYRLLIVCAALVGLAACAAPAATGPQLRVEQAWARPTAAGDSMTGMSATPDQPGMASSAVYFLIVNTGDEADILLGASSTVAATTELHETRMAGDVAEMAPVPRVDIPAHGQFEFKPAGYHLMLTGLTRELKTVETIPLRLQFAKSGAITLDVPIRMEP